ncbi:MAG: MlaD family protein, partial [Spirochaetota bacterium]
MQFKFKHTEKIVGIFLVLVIVGVVGVVILIGKEKRWFEKPYQFTTRFISGEGISPGMQVTIKGIQVGEVRSVNLTPDNWIEVKFSVFEEYTRHIRKDSVVKLRSPLIGSKTLVIIPGDKDMPAMSDNSFIWSEDTGVGKSILKERQKLIEEPDQITRI